MKKIIDSGLYDIERQTGKRPKVMNMTGFSYVKTFGKNQSGTIKFDEVSGPSVYAFTTTTQRNTFTRVGNFIKLMIVQQT
nr:DUF3284 domain-containing protein [Lactococcus fujiensis]